MTEDRKAKEDAAAASRAYKRKYYAQRKAAGLCVDTGKPLPKTWRGKPWHGVRHPHAAIKARDAGRRRIGWTEKEIAARPRTEQRRPRSTPAKVLKAKD